LPCSISSAGSPSATATLSAIGWALGSSYKHFHSNFRSADYAVAAVALFVLGRRGRRLWRRRVSLTEPS
jgi:membrane protein DedA with SNARE-associated domain